MEEQNRQQRRAVKRSKVKQFDPQEFPRVKIAIPYYRSVGQSASLLMRQLGFHGIPGYRCEIDTKQTCFIHLARSEMVSDENFDYTFFVDDDIGFDAKEMAELVEVKVKGFKPMQVPILIGWMKQILDHRKEICGGVYVKRDRPHPPMVFRKDGRDLYLPILDNPKEGLEQVDAIATGFMAIKNTVIEKMFEDFRMKEVYQRRYQWWLDNKPDEWKDLPDHVKTFLENAKMPLYPPFWLDNIFDSESKSYKPMGEDIYFCREAGKLGIPIFVDWSVRLGHETAKYITPEIYEVNYKDQALSERAFHDRKNKNIDGPIEVKKEEAKIG